MSDKNTHNELHTQIQYRLIEKLTESERRYRELVESLREIVFECDRQSHLTFINKAWTEVLGYSVEDSRGRKLEDFIDQSDITAWQSALKQQADCTLELRFADHQGTIFWLELSIRFGSLDRLSGSLIDITERKRAATTLKQTNEELETRVQERTNELVQTNHELTSTLQQLKKAQIQLIQQEKMSGLGQLVAGIAHEINNPVNFIYGNIVYIQDYVQDLLKLLQHYQNYYPDPVSEIQAEIKRIDLDFLQPDLLKILDSIKTGSSRIHEIVKSLRIFARLDEAELKFVDIHHGLDSALTILNHRLKSHPDRARIKIFKYYADLPPIECYAGLLNQVFINILTNAIDALESISKKRFFENCSHDVSQITIRTALLDDNLVQIEISDNGAGIPLDLQERIFEPFFTTKSVGQGTGMGMSISYQIVTERHHGRLKCLSSPGEGTTFLIQIPVQQPANIPR
ncbi:MAG: sensor histidine kinase [Leptolyngbyaceae cyanobacterium]